MKPSLFQPRQFAMPPSLVLVPYFSQGSLFAALQKQALRRQDFLHSSLLWFENMAVISGFIGYPHLLTLLADGRRPGGQGNLFSGFGRSAPSPLQRTGSPAGERDPLQLDLQKIFPTKQLPAEGFPRRLFSRRDAGSAWTSSSAKRRPGWPHSASEKIDIVEMELFPLRWFLQKPFHALVVLSDRVEPAGIRPFADKEKFQHEFERAFNYIIEHINHG